MREAEVEALLRRIEELEKIILEQYRDKPVAPGAAP